MKRRIAPSARIEMEIEALLLDGIEDRDRLAELGRLGARLVIQHAVDDEVTAFLGRARDATRDARSPDPCQAREGGDGMMI